MRQYTPIRSVSGALCLLAASILAALSGCVGSPAASTARVTSGLAIVDATVIDMTGAAPRSGMTVVIQNETIASILPSRSLSLGPDVEQVDGTGKYLIPGLWDMHTHVSEYAPIWMPVMLANGITGVRNMGSLAVALDNHVKQEMSGGAFAGPRLVAAGPLVDGPSSPWPSALKVDSAAKARNAVADLADGGADFIKVYSFLSREAYLAIAGEATDRGLPFGGHVPRAITALEAASAGQHSIEHLDDVLMSTAADEAALRERFAAASAAWRNPATAAAGQAAMIGVNRDLGASYDERKASALFAAFIEHETFQTPTLVTYYTNLHRGEAEILENPALRYIPASLRQQWLSLSPPASAMVASQRAQLADLSNVVAAMQRAGVGLLAGTDTGGTLIVPGDSLHRELALLVDAGLTPLQALQAATLNPAIYLGERDTAGTIEVGKHADLVLLNANPLENIANTRGVFAVVRAGKLHSRGELDRMLADAEKAAATQ